MITTIVGVGAPRLSLSLSFPPLTPRPPLHLLPRRRTRSPAPRWDDFPRGRVLAIHAANVSVKSRETGQTRRRFTSACSHKYPRATMALAISRLNTRRPPARARAWWKRMLPGQFSVRWSVGVRTNELRVSLSLPLFSFRLCLPHSALFALMSAPVPARFLLYTRSQIAATARIKWLISRF